LRQVADLKPTELLQRRYERLQEPTGASPTPRSLHVHHGLLKQADQWEDFVRRRCGQWAARGLPVALRSVRLKESPPHGASIEAWAKARRYAALAAMARDEGVDCVLLAQHRDDQAETVLLQGLRGGGPAGLAGMPACVEREGLWWLRPWLSHPRARIEAYARRHRLSWVEDPSNADMRLARARLRRTVLPALRAAFDGNDAAWCAVAARAREASLVLEEVARMDLATCSAQGAGLSVPRLLELSPARQANLLRCWLQGKCDRGVPQSLVDRLLHEVPASWLDAGVARWPLAEAWIQLYRGTLCVQPPARPGQALMLDLSRPGAHPLPGWSGRLEVRAICTDEHRPGLAASRLVSCVVRGRLPDDRAMALIVHKYGGTSMGSTERIRSVAQRVAKWVRAGHQLVVVPSAMSGETNRLLGLAKELAPAGHSPSVLRELDMPSPATGEQVSVGLLALALQAQGMEAVSYNGWQVPIKTDSSFTKARIQRIDDARVRADLAPARWSSSPASRASTRTGNVTTLGRGGSDTSAVAVAAALEGRRVPDLYRRGRCLHHRPAHRARGAPAAHHQLRGDAGDGQPGLQGAADPLGGVRRQVPGAAARAVQFHALGHRHQ
jgi:tRNA(Ile)-lysidine synthase